MKKSLLVLLAATAILSTGCTGPFRLTKTIHDWQTSPNDEWIDELAFIGCLPVYGVGMLGDAILFNVIEFWGSENPIKTTVAGDAKLEKMADGSIRVTTPTDTFSFVRDAQGVKALDAQGTMLYRASIEGGTVKVTGSDGTVRTFNAAPQTKIL